MAVDLRAMSVTEMARSEGNLRERMMRRLTSIVPAIVVVVSIFTALMPAAAQQQDLNVLVARLNQSHRTGNYPAAFAEVQKLQAAVMARFGTNRPNYGAALNDLATVGAFYSDGPRPLTECGALILVTFVARDTLLIALCSAVAVLSGDQLS